MAHHSDCDVLIAGGGPAGLSVAEYLPPGLDKIVLHQDHEIGKPVRTSGGTWVRDMEALSVPQSLYHTINRFEICSDAARSLHQLSAWKMAVLDVTGLYQWIGQRAAQNGARIRTGTKFISAQRQGDGFLCTARARDGSEQRIRCRYLIDATGVQAAVQTALGLGKKPDRTGIGVEYDFDMPDGVTDKAVLIVGSRALAGYGWIFPAPGNTLRIGVGVIQPDTTVSPRTLMDRMMTADFLDQFDLRLGRRTRVNAGIIPSVPYGGQLVFGNAIRTGDAANFATPTVGEGIRQAMEFGRMLGRAIGETEARGRRAPLRAYERQARRRFARDYHIGFRANQRISGYGPTDWDRSVAQISRLSEAEVTALLRSEFSAVAMARTVLRQGVLKLRRFVSQR